MATYNRKSANMVLTELDVEKSKSDQQKQDDPKAKFRVWLNAYKDTILAKITGVEFCKKEFMQLIKAHAESNMTPEELKVARADAEKDKAAEGGAKQAAPQNNNAQNANAAAGQQNNPAGGDGNK